MSITIRPTAELAAEPLADPHYLPSDPANLLRADPSRRSGVHFASDGVTLAGHLYRPPSTATATSWNANAASSHASARRGSTR